jgi:hypothetical protein
MTAVWQMKLNHTDKLVLLALADNASDEGVCWPSVNTLAKKTCLSRRGVQASVARLQVEGHLARVFRDGRSTNYLIQAIQNGDDLPPAHGVRPPAQDMRPPCAPDAHPPAHGVRPEPSIEPSCETSKNQKHSGKPHKSIFCAKEFPLPVWLPVESWGEFVDHRNSIRKPVGERAATLLIAELDKFRAKGHDPTGIIRTSIMRGWSGLFEPKEHFNGSNHRQKRSYSDDVQSAMQGALAGFETGGNDEVH